MVVTDVKANARSLSEREAELQELGKQLCRVDVLSNERGITFAASVDEIRAISAFLESAANLLQTLKNRKG